MFQLSLNGTWKMKSTDGCYSAQAKVPGSVYQNLLEQGIIEDPFYRENEIDAKAVSEKDYVYSRHFQVEKELLSMEKIFLVCEGIDTIAEIFVNDISVLKCDNMHIVWEAEISHALREGENEIRVCFTSPYKHLETIKARHPDMDLEGHLFQAHLQMRKAAYMFGWDWGPALADMGIWKSMGIKGYRAGRLLGMKADQVHSFEKALLRCEAEMESFGNSENVCRFSLLDPDGTLIGTEESADGKTEFTVNHPKLWWCSGYGEQPLYTIRAELLDQEGNLLDFTEKRVGLRTLSLVREKDRWGESFYFAVNGVEVFARGADYIPEDSLVARVTPQKTRKLLESCRKANFNMIRVWGGGLYPSDAFLDYCDEHGIMIWQDFMFANIVSIWSGEEKENMTREIIFQTKRLRDHPSLALLCGNNETEMMVWEDMNPRYKEMYIQQYEVDMPEIVKELAPQVSYWPSSPSAFGRMQDTENENYGDSHDWQVWHGEKPFTHYRDTFPRFNSEFGLQSFPCTDTIETFTLPEDRNIFSYVMENHQKSKNGNRVINSYISQYFSFPKDFRGLIYLSQMIQMEGIRYGVEHWRRNRNDRRCMGTLFWQVNDCWQVASWASIDCFGRWKGLQYGAKRFFEPVLASACEKGTVVDLFVSNEQLKAVDGTLRWQLFHKDRGLVKEDAIDCHVRRLHTEQIVHLDFGDVIVNRHDAREHYLAYSFEQGNKVTGEGTVMFVQPKHFTFQKPEIKCEKLDSRTWKLTTDHFAKFVEVNFGQDRILSDNYFDLIPGREKIITLEEDAAKAPEVYSLYDSYH